MFCQRSTQHLTPGDNVIFYQYKKIHSDDQEYLGDTWLVDFRDPERSGTEIEEI